MISGRPGQTEVSVFSASTIPECLQLPFLSGRAGNGDAPIKHFGHASEVTVARPRWRLPHARILRSLAHLDQNELPIIMIFSPEIVREGWSYL